MSITSKAKDAFFSQITNRKREFEEKSDDILRKHPRIKAKKEELNDIWLKQLKGNYTLEEAQKKADEAEEELRTLLKSYTYSEDELEYKPLCPSCGDTGYINGKACTCLRQFIVQQSFSQSNISGLLEKENFSSFNEKLFSDGKNLDTAKSAKNKCMQFVNNFGESSLSLLLLGTAGTGKTFLTHCVAGALIEEGYSVLYTTAYEMIDRFTKEVMGKSEEAFSEFAFNCDLLIIDDLGTERQTDFSENMIFNILNERYNQDRPLVISTNLSVNELKKRYGERIISRIFGTTNGVMMQPEDLRIKLKMGK